MAFELGTILRWAFAEQTGRWNAGGKLHFYRSVAKDQEKAVYHDPNGLIPYTNPITLDGIGSVGLIYFNDDEPYYITLYDSTDTQLIWDVDNYSPAGGGGGGTGSTEIDYTNFVMNGQFRFFDQKSFSSIPASEFEVAPYWYFDKSNATATDTIEFLPFLTGTTNPPFSPTYYVRYNCTNVPSGETYKDFYIKIKDVNAFQDQQITISLEQQGTNPVQLIEFIYLQHFGTGGTPSADVVGAIAAHNVNVSWGKVSSTTTLPTISGKTIGDNKDDYVAFIIRLPLDVTTQFDFTNFQINLGDKVLDYEFQTYDKAKIEYRSINYPIHKDLKGLDTEQNVTDITKLITIKEGYCSDSNSTDLFRLKQALTKDISVTWAQGDLVGGLASGLTLAIDTYYNVFLLFRPNGGVDAGFDTDLNAANLLADPVVQSAGYIKERRVATIKTEAASTNIEDYVQTYDEFLWNTPAFQTRYLLPGFAQPQIFSLAVPPGFRVMAHVNVYFTGNNHFHQYMTPTFVDSLVPTSTSNPLATYSIGNHVMRSVLTDNLQQIQQTANNNTNYITYYISTLGWKDWRVD